MMKPLLPVCCLLPVLVLRAEVLYRVVQVESGSQAPATYGSSAVAVNNYGESAGYFDAPDLTFYHIFAFTFGRGMEDLGPTNTPTDIADAYDLNDAGHIVGRVAGGGAFRYTPEEGFRYLGAYDAQAVNNRGQITGWSGDTAYRYTDGVGRESLGSLYGGQSEGSAINDLGWVAGTSDGYSAFLYRDDQGMILLGPGQAFGLNNQGVVVGESWGNWWEPMQAALWKDGQMRLLGNLDNVWWASSQAVAINNNNQVVGFSYRSDRTGAGFIWTEEEGMQDLNALVDPNSGWRWIDAKDINDHGWIAGDGWYQEKRQACLLIPIMPKLDIALAGTNVVITWSPHWPRLVLEAAPYGSPTNWQAVPGGTNDPVVLPITAASQVFRLSQYETLAPKLSVTTVGTNVVVSWSPPWPDYTLESAPSLDSSTWTPAPGGNNTPVTLPNTHSDTFFRLRK